MILNPNGKKKEDGNSHISLFLAMTDPDDVSDWEVNVVASSLCSMEFATDIWLFKVLDYDQACDYDDRIDWRFHKMKMEWGFIELLSHDTLRDASNGFLVDDRSIFGVEVFGVRPGEGESLSFVKEPANGLYTWKISNFSALNKYNHFSEGFTVEGRKWYV
ncbi:uncharacterized protein LOC7487422 [Populus trichocarpa]|uniref:uncharacterized protein LOC7487422 n=1 Tax=Populus trichocarpa TaxID=3694 RepID=UPI000D187F07|nr:uncharacterized protein LOC7487422 [Populus trichocarpa]|eukprot:XP_024455392.1 uncharacterized protein LOC7487422 [Populus trichocarpa]